MKKLTLLCAFCLFLVNVCVLGWPSENRKGKVDQQVNIEKDARISILMDDASYVQAITKLWNKKYPQHKNTLHVDVASYVKRKKLDHDITWIADQDIETNKKALYTFKDIEWEIPVEMHLQRDIHHFLPVEGKGLLFACNLSKLSQFHKGKEDLTSFETLKSKQSYVYFHNRNADYVDPFLIHSQSLEDITGRKDEDFKDRLIQYRQLYKELSLFDDQYAMHNFYEGKYLCGLLMNDGHYEESDVYKEGNLYFAQMPTYKQIAFSPMIDTYGFAVNKHMKYPEAVRAFLLLIRSKEGMQALLDHTSKYPLITEEALSKLSIFDHSKKEIIVAMNYSQLRNLSLSNKMQGSDFYAILQNGMFTTIRDETLRKKLIQQLV